MFSVGATTYHPYVLVSTTTLTTSLNDTKRTFEAFGARKLELEVYYIPLLGQSNRTCTIFLEFGTTSGVYVPLTVLQATSAADGTMQLLENPLTILGATGGTTYGRKIEIEDLLPHFRVSAKEDGSANFGTVRIVGTLIG